MAILNLQPPFDNITGTLEKRGIIHRQKHYKDDDGRILFIGKQEAYAVRNPRDYRKNPPQGEELRNINLFRQANSLTPGYSVPPTTLPKISHSFPKRTVPSSNLSNPVLPNTRNATKPKPGNPTRKPPSTAVPTVANNMSPSTPSSAPCSSKNSNPDPDNHSKRPQQNNQINRTIHEK